MLEMTQKEWNELEEEQHIGDAAHKMVWSEFCLSLQETVEQQEREFKKAVHQMGEFRLSPQFHHLEVRCDKWLKMTPAQREAHLKRCFNSPLDKLGRFEDAQKAASAEEENALKLSVTCEESGITTLSLVNLKQMWSSASKILRQDQGVLSVPWDTTGSQKMVFNGLGNLPCNVTVNGYTMKCSCPKYKSAMICDHSVAVAEHDLCLQQFLAIVRKRKNLPDPHELIANNLSTCAGKKKKTKRKGKANSSRPPLMTISERSGRP
ncbi:hypothetical protein QZH41_020587, partial [Actinostola sp. cb2023]